MLLNFSVIFVLLDTICVCRGFLPGRYDLLGSSVLEPECGSMEIDCRDFTNAILCDRVQFCIDTKWADVELPFDESETCESCVSILSDAQLGLEGKSNEYMTLVLTDNLNQVCEIQLSGYEKCVEFVDKFVPAFLTLLSSHLGSHRICYLFLECSSDGRDISSMMTSGDSYDVPSDDVYGMGPFEISIDRDYTCDECKDFALSVSTSVKKMGKNAFVSRFKRICKQVKIPFCNKVIKGAAPNLYNWIIRGPTQQLCQYVGMCRAGLSENDDDSSEEDEKDEISSEESDEASENKDISINSAGASPMCPLCEFAMEELQKQLSNKQTEEEIKQSIEQLCSYLPATISKECDDFVNTFGDKVFEIVLRELNTSNVCVLLNICPAIDGIEGRSVCAICHYQMRLVHELLNMDHVKDLIELEMQGVCDYVPNVWHATCVEFVDLYLGGLLDKLKDTDLTIICDNVDICKVQPGIEMSLQIEQRSLNLARVNKCQACIEVLKNVKDYAVLFTKSMDFVCYFFPLYTDMCKMMVDQFGPLIVKMIIAAVQPELICRTIRLCPTADHDSFDYGQWNETEADRFYANEI